MLCYTFLEMGDQVGYDCEVLNDKFQKNIYDVCVMMVYVYYLYSVSMYRRVTMEDSQLWL